MTPRLAAAAAAVLALTACASAGPSGRPAGAAPPTPVASLDLDRYAGRWFEIARYPNGFQEDCGGVTAEYAKRPDGAISVTNTCRTGRPRVARGVAHVIEGSNGARLAVNFAPIPLPRGQGNYHVLFVDPDYTRAVVGEPSGRYLWFLARTPTITPEARAEMNAVAVREGYRLDMLEETPQP